MGPSAIQILVIVGIIVLFFGATRIAGLGQGLGDGIRNFRKALGEGGDEKPGQLPPNGESADRERQV
jgi:sec-independent protein translocase protein TatA